MIFTLPVLNPIFVMRRTDHLRARSKRLAATRAEFLAADNACAFCREPLDWRNSSLDHVVPLSRGGTNARRNLVLVCRRCNRWKGHRTVEELIASVTAGLFRLRDD